MHIESKHEKVQHSCDQCNYKSSYKVELKIHIDSKHEGVCYSCYQCSHTSSRKNDLEHEGVQHFLKSL